MDSELICQLCEQQFTADNLPRLLVECGHTYCEKCLKKLMTEKKGKFKILCPEDGQTTMLPNSQLTNFPKNLALIKILDAKKLKDNSLEMSKIPKNDSMQDDEVVRDFVNAIDSPNAEDFQHGEIEQQQSNSSKDESAKKGVETGPKICPTHQKPLEVVCILDLKQICTNCAIFGQHKGHEFKSLEEIQNERSDYYNSILGIMESKENLAERIGNESTCAEIMGILSKKKDKMQQSIKNQYKSLIDKIQQQQNESLASLDSIASKTQAKLKNLMKIEPSLMEKYENWEIRSFDEIKILEGDNFEAKLHLLFADVANSSTDILDEGDKLLGQMHKQEENMIQEVEVTIENIGVDFNSEILNHIEGFAEVYDEAKKRKLKTRITKLENNVLQKQNTSISKKQTASKSQASPPSSKKIEEPVQEVKQQKGEVLIEEDLLGSDEMEPEPILKVKPKFPEHGEIPEAQFQQAGSQKKEEETKDKSFDQPPLHQETIPSPVLASTIKTSKTLQKPSPYQQKSVKSDNSFSLNRPNKKKLLKVKSSPKYEKILHELGNDALQLLDLTNAQLGDANIILISEFLQGSKVKTVKLIRNKIYDDAVAKIMPYMGSVITLNLSQNFLTDKVLDILISARSQMPEIKSVILSQNKIIERKHKAKIDKLRAMDVTVSV